MKKNAVQLSENTGDKKTWNIHEETQESQEDGQTDEDCRRTHTRLTRG